MKRDRLCRFDIDWNFGVVCGCCCWLVLVLRRIFVGDDRSCGGMAGVCWRLGAEKKREMARDAIAIVFVFVSMDLAHHKTAKLLAGPSKNSNTVGWSIIKWPNCGSVHQKKAKLWVGPAQIGQTVGRPSNPSKNSKTVGWPITK